MNNPSLYMSSRSTIAQVTSVYLPKILDIMSWDFRRGNIMDYGSGPGTVGHQYILPKAEATDSQLHFVDISPTMVDYSRQNFEHPRISHVVGSLPDNFPLSPEFDRVLAVNVVHMIRDIDPVLAGIKSVLKPGGQFGCTAATLDNVMGRTWQHLINSPVWQPYMGGLKDYLCEWTTVPEGEDGTAYFRKVLVERPGMKEVFLLFEEISAEMTMEQYLDFSLSLNPFAKGVPAKLADKLREEYASFLCTDRQIPRDSTVVKYPVTYFCAVAQK